MKITILNSIIISVAFLAANLAAAQDLQQRPAEVVITNAPGKTPNTHPMYMQLRSAGLSGEQSGVNKLTIKRDIGTFYFDSGSFFWMAPVNGKVTGAVFLGNGTFEMAPTLEQEKRSLSFLAKQSAMKEEFDSIVFRFTDGTYDEVKKAAGVTTGSARGQGEFNDIRSALKSKIHYNLEGRVLQDVLSPQPGGLFWAFIHGQKYNGKELFAIDPLGVLYFHPEEVMLMTWDDNKFGFWSVSHFADEYRNGTAKGTQVSAALEMSEHRLDTTIEKSGKLDGDATTFFTSNIKGLTVMPLNLFPTLRVTSVTGQNGEALDFIQEGKDDDPQFYVVLAKPLDKGEKYSFRAVYAGKDAVSSEGGGNYFPIARDDWYPNSYFGDYATYNMTFRTPKSLTMVATGEKLKEAKEGDWLVTNWQSAVPEAVAGFNIGSFKAKTKKLDGMDFEISTYANDATPDWLKGLENYQSVTTTGMMDKASAEAEIAIKLYTDYFGKSSYKKLSMTQQTAGNFGQAWPELVYLPLTSFLDSLTRYRVMGFDPKGYFKVVAPHEVAHQWWGHTVGFNSYRDQWMSEGFAELSASIFMQIVQKKPDEFIKFWNDERELLTEKNRYGYRAIDVGPVTMGYRLNNGKVGGNITRELIYPKGGYILHMIRMMMWSNKTQDQTFKETMRDFTATYANRSATTEDFKAMVEKHMTPEMDMDGNHRMDWFFNEYVFGTALPSYKFEQSVQNGELYFKITQSNVTPDFKMLVPVYVDLGNGKIGKLGSATLIGNTSQEARIPIGQWKEQPKRALLNYYDDVLAISEK